MDDHESAATEIAGARIGHGHRKADGDRRIDRITASLQDIGADLRRQRLLRHRHAVLGDDSRRAGEPRGQTAVAMRRGG
jgi:hypothetical protein